MIFLVGAWCKKLEVANIVSRIKQENFHTYTAPIEPYQPPLNQNIEDNQVAQNVPNPPHPPNPQDGIIPAQHPLPNDFQAFPSITLKFCVSDIGLNALEHGCKLLRRITMNKIGNHSPAQVSKHPLPNNVHYLSQSIMSVINNNDYFIAWNNTARSKKFDQRSSTTRIHQFRIHRKGAGSSNF